MNKFNISNLIVEEAAVGAKDGKVTFNINTESSINSSMFASNKNSQTITCESINLNTYIKTNNIEKIDYLKIDCEGAEYELFQTITNTNLKRIHRVVIETHSEEINSFVEKRLLETNFKIYKHPSGANNGGNIIFAVNFNHHD